MPEIEITSPGMKLTAEELVTVTEVVSVAVAAVSVPVGWVRRETENVVPV